MSLTRTVRVSFEVQRDLAQLASSVWGPEWPKILAPDVQAAIERAGERGSHPEEAAAWRKKKLAGLIGTG